eukprot:6389240-Amphidinium_carterae.1
MPSLSVVLGKCAKDVLQSWPLRLKTDTFRAVLVTGELHENDAWASYIKAFSHDVPLAAQLLSDLRSGARLTAASIQHFVVCVDTITPDNQLAYALAPVWIAFRLLQQTIVEKRETTLWKKQQLF